MSSSPSIGTPYIACSARFLSSLRRVHIAHVSIGRVVYLILRAVVVVVVMTPHARRQSDWSKFMQLLRLRDPPDSAKTLAHHFGVAVMTTAERRERLREKHRLKRERREARRARRRERLKGDVVKAFGFIPSIPSVLTPRFLQDSFGAQTAPVGGSQTSLGAQSAPSAAGDPAAAEKKRSRLWARARSALGLSKPSTSHSSSSEMSTCQGVDASMTEANPIAQLRESIVEDAPAEGDKEYVPLQARSRPRYRRNLGEDLGAVPGDISPAGIPGARA